MLAMVPPPQKRQMPPPLPSRSAPVGAARPTPPPASGTSPVAHPQAAVPQRAPALPTRPPPPPPAAGRPAPPPAAAYAPAPQAAPTQPNVAPSLPQQPYAAAPPQPRSPALPAPPPFAPVQPQSRPAAPSQKPGAGAAPAPVAVVGPNGDLITGTTICGRYKVERILGRGGMGAVYAVRHVNTGEMLALKVLNPALASNAQAVERFRTEARAPVRIGTDHVVRVVDADVSPELGDVPILVMELLDGRDLGTELKRRGAIPAGEVVLYLRQVARALDKAHSLGIIHRDLKPANLYLTQRDDGTPLVKILDFGIAKLADGVSGELTQDGTIFGTPWYMSPEQARGQASKVGPSIDLWALGLIAFRLLTGRNYWTAEGMAALIGQIVYDPMPPPSQMAPHLGPRFDEWFARACNREVEKRFTNASEEIKALAEALGVSSGPQLTGQLDASQFPASYGASPGMSAAGMSMPNGLGQSGNVGLSQSGGGLSQSGGGQSHPGGSLSQSGGLLSQSGGGLSQSGGLLSQSGGGLGSSGGPLATSAGLSSSGAPISQSGSTAAPFSATNAPMSVARPSNMLSIAMGVLIAVLVAGGATAGWVLLGHKKQPAPSVAITAAPPPEPTAAVSTAPTPTAAIPAPEPTAAVEAPPPTATATPSATAAAAPTPSVAIAAPGPGKSAAPATTTTAKSAPTATTAKLPPKTAPKVDKIKF
jgi:eukaryotic-like serine/threonine-protein kinase